MNHLDRIVERTRVEVERRKRDVPLVPEADPAPRRPFADALRRPGLSLIAEHKRASPSAGTIRNDLRLEEVVLAYERGGAAALSVLTEGPSFGGTLDDIGAARAASNLPILRKDFIVDPYQLGEAVSAGADAVLLIVAALGDEELVALRQLAGGLGLATLVEVHDERELERAAAAGAELIGINNRNLVTLEVDTRRTFELLDRVPEGATVVAESGFCERAQLDELSDAGVDGVLIGEALMRSGAIEPAVRALTAPTM
ncbi:MAG TPA: indole-3-glycerol phosphate synthase TrpC [Solirubrobacteraceae bacterium]|jgi:indole-3-glycerol phosphate synthase